MTEFLVGYGDQEILTNPGRITAIFACLWGSVIYSLFILSMNLLTKQDDNDKLAYKEFKTKDGIQKIRKTAGKIIGNFIMFNYTRKKKEELISKTKTNNFRNQTPDYKLKTDHEIKNIHVNIYMFNMIRALHLYHKKRM